MRDLTQVITNNDNWGISGAEQDNRLTDMQIIQHGNSAKLFFARRGTSSSDYNKILIYSVTIEFVTFSDNSLDTSKVKVQPAELIA